MINEKIVRQAAFWEETICPACGEMGGEARYECFACGKAVVMPAVEAVAVLDNVERDGNGDAD